MTAAEGFCVDPNCFEERFPHLEHDTQEIADIKKVLAAIDHLVPYSAWVLDPDEDAAIKRLAARVYR